VKIAQTKPIAMRIRTERRAVFIGVW